MAAPLDPTRAPALRSPEFGLALGYVLGRHLLGMEDLHYGFWTDGLPVEIRNLSRAQAAYTEFLVSHIPDGVRAILDVGCGSGNTAKQLLGRGYRVDAVSPNPFLTRVAREALGERATVFEGKFEELETDRRYDLLLFSESFLFIQPDRALAQAERLLNPGGYLLITDIFRMPAEGRSPIGGGHQLPAFRELMTRSRFELLEDLDLTARIAPTFDLLDRAYREAIRPAYDLLVARFWAAHPWVMRAVRWLWRRKLARLEEKHFSGRRDGANFARYKSYRLFLFRLR
ncbi:MAG TPA: methyltransferase domain-containing protein [Gemmatimonadales bacterium]|nr:methyltransferase domain-containing protein [Gemmatimonadales bacterium]